MRYFCLFLLLAGAVSLSAQDSPTEQTIFNRNNIKHWGGFGAPIFTLTQVGEHRGFASGGGGGVVLNNFFIGGFGQGEYYGTVAPASVRDRELAMGFGGLWLGYTAPSHKAIHLYSSLRLGIGGVSLGDPDDFDFDDRDRSSVLFVGMPEIGLELNLTHWMRLAITGGYRLTTGLDDTFPIFNKADFNRPFGSITLRLGGFGYRR
jgi:hypothetical protein